MGTAPLWLITRAGSVSLGLAGAYPMLRAVLAGQVHGSTLAAQLAASAVVLGGYLMRAVRANPSRWYSSWRRHQGPVSLRPRGARSSQARPGDRSP
jgi:hypothetical protein